MAYQEPPQRHWRSYGTDPLPTPAECDAVADAGLPVVVPAHHLRPLRQIRHHNESHDRRWRDRTLADILSGCATSVVAAEWRGPSL